MSKGGTPEFVRQIRRAYQQAQPKASNPAWGNTHRDLGRILQYADALEKENRQLREALKKSMDSATTILTADGKMSRDFAEMLDSTNEGRALLAALATTDGGRGMKASMTYAETWRAAYKRLHGKEAPVVTVKRGWARIEGAYGAIRERELLTMANNLNERAAYEGK